MSKLIKLQEEAKECYVKLYNKASKVNVWCDEDVRSQINDKDFGNIVKYSIDKLSVLKGELIGEILVGHIGKPVVVRFCIDEEEILNIDGIRFNN